MNSKISDKDKKDWEDFLLKNENLPNKEINIYQKKNKKKYIFDLHGYSLNEANQKIKDLQVFYVSKIIHGSMLLEALEILLDLIFIQLLKNYILLIMEEIGWAMIHHPVN